MTQPTRFTRRNFGNSHAYYYDGQKIPGVTSIIGVLDKPALVEWSAKTTARHALDNWDRLSGMNQINRYEELVKARQLANKTATVCGKRIHALAEKIARGEEVDPRDKDLRTAAQVYADLLDEWDLEPVGIELSVLNRSYQYAGTLDAILRSPRLGTVIADIKTGKRAYSEVALQLAAYRYCDTYLEEVEKTGPRGGRQPSDWVEAPMVDVDGAVVIYIERETEESPAAAHLLPVQAGAAEHEVFLYLREIYEAWIQRTDWKHKDSPLFSPPIGDELHPEMTDVEIQEALA